MVGTEGCHRKRIGPALVFSFRNQGSMVLQARAENLVPLSIETSMAGVVLKSWALSHTLSRLSSPLVSDTLGYTLSMVRSIQLRENTLSVYIYIFSYQY